MPAESDTQRIDDARAAAALDRARDLTETERGENQRPSRNGPQRVGLAL